MLALDHEQMPVVDSRTVFFVGLRYTSSQINEIQLYSHRAMMFDNNTRSKKDYARFPSNCVFDDSRGVGLLAYEWCKYNGYVDNFAGGGWQNNRDIAKGMSSLAKYVSDIETGLFKLPNSGYINLCVDSYELESKQWDMLARRVSVTPEALTTDGMAIDRYISRMEERDAAPKQDKG
jgi:hypothetical protein